MGMIQRDLLKNLDQENFGPEQIVEQLSYLQEIFYFLKRIELNLDKIRPVITYMVAVSIWAFRQVSNNGPREMPAGFPEILWDRLSQGSEGKQLFDFLEKSEPDLWDYFLNVLQTAQEQEDWSQHNLTVASLVFATILTTCILIFWPKDSLASMDEDFSSLGFYDM